MTTQTDRITNAARYQVHFRNGDYVQRTRGGWTIGNTEAPAELTLEEARELKDMGFGGVIVRTVIDTEEYTIGCDDDS